jgi:hypothetical protein
MQIIPSPIFIIFIIAIIIVTFSDHKHYKEIHIAGNLDYINSTFEINPWRSIIIPYFERINKTQKSTIGNIKKTLEKSVLTRILSDNYFISNKHPQSGQPAKNSGWSKEIFERFIKADLNLIFVDETHQQIKEKLVAKIISDDVNNYLKDNTLQLSLNNMDIMGYINFFVFDVQIIKFPYIHKTPQVHGGNIEETTFYFYERYHCIYIETDIDIID